MLSTTANMQTQIPVPILIHPLKAMSMCLAERPLQPVELDREPGGAVGSVLVADRPDAHTCVAREMA